MRISDSNNIKDTISDAESICIIKDYERHTFSNGKDLDTTIMQQVRMISVYVECMYLKKRVECPQCGTHKKKIEILYLNEPNYRTSYIDNLLFWYSTYIKTQEKYALKSFFLCVLEYLTLYWNEHKDWEIQSLVDIKIEKL